MFPMIVGHSSQEAVSIEAVTGTLNTTGWPLGRHTLFVRGRDALSNWGPVGAVFIDVVVPVELLDFAVE